LFYPTTAKEYTLFLNATKTIDLCDEKINFIVHTGAPGNYHYTVIQGKEAATVCYISEDDLLCYFSWKEDRDYLIEESLSSFYKIDASLKVNFLALYTNDELPKSTLNKKNNRGEDSELTWSRFLLGGFFTVSSLFSERCSAPNIDSHLPLSPERRESISSATSIEEESEFIVSSKKQIAFHEGNVRELEARASSGNFREAAGNMIAGIGHMNLLALQAILPGLNQARLSTLGAIGGYGVGALVAYLRGGSPFEMMNEGGGGAFTAATATSTVNGYFIYRDWNSYSEGLRFRYEKMKHSFSQIRSINERLAEAKKNKNDYCNNFLNEIQRDRSKSRGLESEVLKMLAHRILREKNQSTAIDEFITRGTSFYGLEVMRYSFPLKNREPYMANESSLTPQEVDRILADIQRVASATENLEDSGASYTSSDAPSNFIEVAEKNIIYAYAIEEERKARKKVNDLEAIKGDSFRDALIETGSGLRHVVFAGLLTLARPFIGVCMGSFIGVAIPMTYTFGNVYTPWLENMMNTSGVVYGTYFLSSDLSTRRSVIQSKIQKASAAFARAAEAWNRPSQIVTARQELLKASERKDVFNDQKGLAK